jgi:hypothetical protein
MSALRQEQPNGRETASRGGETPGTGREAPRDVAGDDASVYCPVCSQRLEGRQCKLVCPSCGYYLSCSDYY